MGTIDRHRLSQTLSPTLPCFGFVQDGASQKILNQLFEMNLWPKEGLIFGNWDQCCAWLSDHDTPKLLLLDLDGQADLAVAIHQLEQHLKSGCLVIAFGEVNDITRYRLLRQLGIDDYLPKPLSLAALKESIDQAEQVAKTKTPAKVVANGATHECQAVALVGCRGGIGVTSLAVALAKQSARLNKTQKTILLDLDIAYGSAALILDVEPGRGLVEALEDPSRLDALFLERAMVKLGDNLQLLAGDMGLEAEKIWTSDAPIKLIERLNETSEILFVDLPRAQVARYPQLLSKMDHVLLVTDLSINSLRNALRLIKQTQNHAPTAQIHLLLAGADRSRVGDVSPGEMVKLLGQPIALTVPFDPTRASKAWNQALDLLFSRLQQQANNTASWWQKLLKA